MERRSWADYTKGAAFELKQNSSWCGTRTATGTKPRFTLVVLPLPIRQLAWFLTEAFCTARPQERAGRANVLVQSMKSYLDRAARQVAEDEVGRAITGETSPFHSLTRQVASTVHAGKVVLRPQRIAMPLKRCSQTWFNLTL
jgi:hypothetical protein